MVRVIGQLALPLDHLVYVDLYQPNVYVVFVYKVIPVVLAIARNNMGPITVSSLKLKFKTDSPKCSENGFLILFEVCF